MRAEAQNTADQISKSLELLAQRLDVETAPYRLEEFNARVEDPNLWDNPDAAQKLMRERQSLVDAIDTYEGIKQELADNVELIEFSAGRRGHLRRGEGAEGAGRKGRSKGTRSAAEW